MKSINREDFKIVGSVIKTHGVKGEISISLNLPVKFKEWIFVEIRQKPVPFFVEYSKPISYDLLLVKIKDINTPENASAFIGLNIMLPVAFLKNGKTQANLNILFYQLIDINIGQIGTVESIDEYPQQFIIKTTYKGKELLIPAIEPIIKEINVEHKTVYLNLPEGYLDEMSS